MATSEQDVQGEGRYVLANATDVYYVEVGQGEPLLLLHGGAVSTSQLWAGTPFAYVSHMDTFAEHFRVIVPDTRGSGRTVNPGGRRSGGKQAQRRREPAGRRSADRQTRAAPPDEQRRKKRQSQGRLPRRLGHERAG